MIEFPFLHFFTEPALKRPTCLISPHPDVCGANADRRSVTYMQAKPRRVCFAQNSWMLLKVLIITIPVIPV